VLCVNIDVMNEHTTSVFKVENIESIALEDGGSIFLQNVGFYLHSNKVSKPRRLRTDIKTLHMLLETSC